MRRSGRSPRLVERAAPAENNTILAASATAPQRLAPEPVTTKDPQITLDDLELLLAPMTKDEIEVEAEAWFDLVRGQRARDFRGRTRRSPQEPGDRSPREAEGRRG